MTESANNGYLDKLVIKYIIQNIGLEILAGAPEQERPRIFLDKIGWVQKKDYIEDTLNAFLPVALPNGGIYVFTPDDSFKYERINGSVSNVGIRSSRDLSSTFYDALHDILKLAEANRSKGKLTLAPVLFFDNASRDRFETELRKKLSKKEKESYSASLQHLNIPNYGTVALHEYAIN